MWLKTKSLRVTGAWARERLRLDLPFPGGEMDDIAWSSEGKDTRYPGKAHRLLAKPRERGRKLLPCMAQTMAGTRSRRTEASN
jgi:hypothetical protein